MTVYCYFYLLEPVPYLNVWGSARGFFVPGQKAAAILASHHTVRSTVSHCGAPGISVTSFTGSSFAEARSFGPRLADCRDF